MDCGLSLISDFLHWTTLCTKRVKLRCAYAHECNEKMTKKVFSPFFCHFLVVSGLLFCYFRVDPRATSSLLSRSFDFFGASGLVRPFAPTSLVSSHDLVESVFFFMARPEISEFAVCKRGMVSKKVIAESRGSHDLQCEHASHRDDAFVMTRTLHVWAVMDF